ncbi:MAG: hypothetical protein ACM3MF_08735 [Anaerolineae bacterium]
MPEVTSNTKIILGSIAAAAALLTGMLGNVLAAHISAFLSGTPAKTTGKRPVILWVAFFVSASLSVLAGSFATFAPLAPSTPVAQATPTSQPTASPAPTQPGEPGPEIVVTNLGGYPLRADPRSLFVICRDTIEVANTSDIPTSVVAVGMTVNLDGTALTIQPAEYEGVAVNAQAKVGMTIWRTPVLLNRYNNVKTVDKLLAVLGDRLPVRVDARSTASVFVDYAIQFTGTRAASITATHLLHFPDVKDIQTGEMKCQ